MSDQTQTRHVLGEGYLVSNGPVMVGLTKTNDLVAIPDVVLTMTPVSTRPDDRRKYRLVLEVIEETKR